MAINDYGVRFTEEKYATKNEVARELKMSMVDAIWSPILKYRSQYNRYLSIKSIDRGQLTICMCPTVSSVSNNVEAKLIRLLSEYNKLGNGKELANKYLLASLKNVAKKQKLGISEGSLFDIVNGFERSISEDDKVITHYLNALNYIDAKSYNAVDEDFLAGIYSKVTGKEELTSFYREDNYNSPENRVLIDRVYTSAPHQFIQVMMDNLFEFINKSNVPSATKALTAYYYVQYVKPFASFNEEIGVLLMKAILAHETLGTVATFIPFEALLNDTDSGDMLRLFNEVQKTNDVTYFLLYAYRLVEELVQKILDDTVNFTKEELREDFYQIDKEEEKETPAPVVEEENKEEPELVTEPVKEEAPAEEVKVEETPVVEEVPAAPIKKPAPIVKPVEPVKMVQEKIAVSYIPPQLDEKEAARLEVHLLECDPLLKKAQAKFYARHCTMGKMYTIAEFKKYCGCVYETARTSMDQLAELGYYQKQQVKNKFVYTPIARK